MVCVAASQADNSVNAQVGAGGTNNAVLPREQSHVLMAPGAPITFEFEFEYEFEFRPIL